MAPLTVSGIDELKELIGQSIGPTDWREVTQEMIDEFAELSGDDQWIHVDVERAKSESPFGTTVAHGNLTLSMIDGMRLELLSSSGFKLGVNYGWNRVRFPAPVPAGSRIRATAAGRQAEDDRHAGRGRERAVCVDSTPQSRIDSRCAISRVEPWRRFRSRESRG